MIVLVIPVVALVLGIAWVTAARRPAKPLDAADEVEAHRRMMRALAPRTPASRRRG